MAFSTAEQKEMSPSRDVSGRTCTIQKKKKVHENRSERTISKSPRSPGENKYHSTDQDGLNMF